MATRDRVPFSDFNAPYILSGSSAYIVTFTPFLDFSTTVLIVLVLISFSHGYSAILAAKLMIKLDST